MKFVGGLVLGALVVLMGAVALGYPKQTFVAGTLASPQDGDQAKLPEVALQRVAKTTAEFLEPSAHKEPSAGKEPSAALSA